jgi:hypothetical protein
MNRKFCGFSFTYHRGTVINEFAQNTRIIACGMPYPRCAAHFCGTCNGIVDIFNRQMQAC